MAAPTETTKGAADAGAESPTTARPLDLDDDDVQDASALADDTNATPATATATSTADATTTTKTTTPLPASVEAEEETPPSKPPRPLTENQKNEMILKEAFPGVDTGVIKAVLRASGGRVEPAFNALLEMTDPDAVKNEPAQEPAPPPQPPRPSGRRELSQLEADELYARQLAEHYNNVGQYEARTSNQPRQRQQPQDDDEEREYSFIDDELPVIRDNLRKGFFETQTKVNSWITTLKKRIEENFDESEDPADRPGQHYGRPGEPSRRSGDYDNDPQVISDDFAGMRFTSDGPNRPSAQHTSSYRQSSSSPRRGADGRRVNFKDETEEINMYDASPQVPPKDTPPKVDTKASKWQPLSAVDPSPIGDNDPFSLGDSEDERDAKDAKDKQDKPKEPLQDDNERLKQAAAEAMADSLVDESKSGDKKP